MYINNFGRFWKREQVLWTPGAGAPFRMLGRQGTNTPALRMADLRGQRGLYVLFDDLGVRYVGVAFEQGLGDALKEHTQDHLAESWTRFSWYGMSQVLERKDAHGLHDLREIPEHKNVAPAAVLTDLQALVLQIVRADNAHKTHFLEAQEWLQVGLDESTKLLNKVG
jgi:hypothetical protein